MIKLLNLVCSLLITFSFVQADYDCQFKKDGFYSDLEYCHIYWRCNYGLSEEYECPAGTAWNHKEGRCDWLDNVDCTRDGTIEITEPTEPTTTEETLPPQFPSTSDSFDEVTDINGAVVFSSTQPKSAELKLAELKLSNYREEKNLTDQILELLEENTVNLTGISLRFENFQGLNLTEVVKQLEAKSMNLTAEMEILNNQTAQAYNLKMMSFNDTESTNEITTTTIKTTTTPQDFDLFCEELPAETGFMPDPYGCNKYIRCNHGKSQRFTCASGTVWDIANSMCLWSESVDCADRPLEAEEVEEKQEKSGDEYEYEYEYYTDEEIEALEKEAKAKIAAESSTMSTSKVPKGEAEGLVDVTETSMTTTQKSSVCQTFGSYFIEDETNCGSYFLCQNGKETKMSCPEKQLFDLETSLCADFQTVFCGMRPVNFADQNQCLSKRDGIYPDIERECRVFYQCIKQEKVREATCPVPLKFNAITGRCDNPLNILSPCGSYNPNFNSASSLFNFSRLVILVAASSSGFFLLL